MKRELRALLAGYDLVAIADRAERATRVLGALVPLTFDRDPLITWRAVEAMGVAAERIADREPAAVREHLRRLNWLITEESGGICWRAPEAMAEIVARLPHACAGMLWAIGRLGSVAAPHVEDVVPAMAASLEHADPQVRGVAVWALGRVGHTEIVAARAGLADDGGAVELYLGGELTRTTVGAVSRLCIE